MGSKRARGAKALIVPQDESQNASEISSLSTIDKASFLEGLQKHNSNPLHSTAVEEDLNVQDEEHMYEGKPQRKQVPQTLKTTVTQRGAAVKRKQTETDGEIDTEVDRKKRSRRSAVETVRPEKGRVTKKKKGKRAELDVVKESDASSSRQKSDEPAPAADSRKQLVGKKPANRRSAVQTLRPVKNKQMKRENKRKNESSNGKSNDSDSESQEDCESGTTQQRRKKILSSEEEVDEDTSWNPSPQKAKVYSLSRTRKTLSDGTKSRKSSSGSTSGGAQRSSISEQKKKRRVHQGRTDLEVVLDAFLDFCDQYRESVESKAVKQSIDCFSNNVKEQLLEKISSYKELKVLKRENAKTASLIRRKTQRLLDAKRELMRAERQVWLLQKQETELKLRLADLRRGHSFLCDIRELNRQYLDHRDKHPKEKEMYGASSLPALLLETKHIQTAECQLRGINN